MRYRKPLLLALLLTIVTAIARGQQLADRYTKQHPLVIVCDWDKAPYEFLDDKGQPAGSNIDVLNAILGQMNISYRFVMKEWSNAVKTFERDDADLILANVNRFKGKGYYATQIINYNRQRVAMLKDTADIISVKTLEEEGVVLKAGDYTNAYFNDIDSTKQHLIEYQSPKVALTGLLAGDNKYFVWGEEPLKWKLRKLNLEGIYLNDVGIPVSEVHIIGRDKELIDQIDDQFSRMKQSGELATILDKWMHPERVNHTAESYTLPIILGVLLVALLILLFYWLAKRHVLRATRQSTELNEMMNKALHMGNFMVMQYDIAHDRLTNNYGHILPNAGMSLDEFTSRIHPDQQAEFKQKVDLLIRGRERKFELNKRWNAGTADAPHWLNFQGHAVCETDSMGRPAYIINAIHDVTSDLEEDKAARDLVKKYTRLVNIPYIAMSFYDKDGWLMGTNDTMKALCGMDKSMETSRFWQKLNMFDVPLFRNAYSAKERGELFVCQHMHYPDIGLDKYIEFNIKPLFDTNGNLVNYLVSAYDITDIRNSDLERRRQDRQIADMQARIADCRSQLDMLLDKGHCCLRDGAASDEVTEANGRYYKQKDGIALDVTDIMEKRRQLQAKTELAEQSVQLKSGFMASMTHELRTPLNAIVGFTGILETLTSADERAEYVRIIRNSSDMLQRLINDIIEASSFSGGLISIKPEDIDFASAFDDICLTLQRRVQNPQVAFVKDNPYDTFLTSVDIERILQLYTNFVTNAVKFTQQGEIRVGYRYERHGLYIYCRDTGLGIPKDKQQLIFNRFVKLNEFVQGTGMGLAICKNIVESCQGEIGVESDGEGTGSTFWAWLPCERKLTKTNQYA